MHLELIQRYPRLGKLYSRSKTTSPDNYFSIYSTPEISPSTTKQFDDWENLLSMLDDGSFEIFLRKTSGRVSAMTDKNRGWSQLVESVNELRAYEFALSLGYSEVRLLNESSSLPDIEASDGEGTCLIEVKTINESDLEISLRGEVQMGERGIPIRFQRAIRHAYKKAIEQIESHPKANTSRGICYLIINLDLRTVLDDGNQALLHDFIQEIKMETEIYYNSRYWPASI